MVMPSRSCLNHGRAYKGCTNYYEAGAGEIPESSCGHGSYLAGRQQRLADRDILHQRSSTPGSGISEPSNNPAEHPGIIQHLYAAGCLGDKLDVHVKSCRRLTRPEARVQRPDRLMENRLDPGVRKSFVCWPVTNQRHRDLAPEGVLQMLCGRVLA